MSLIVRRTPRPAFGDYRIDLVIVPEDKPLEPGYVAREMSVEEATKLRDDLTRALGEVPEAERTIADEARLHGFGEVRHREQPAHGPNFLVPPPGEETGRRGGW